MNSTANEIRMLMQTLLYLFVDRATYLRRRELRASDQTKTRGKISSYSKADSCQSLDLRLKENVRVTKTLPVWRKYLPTRDKVH